MQPSHCSSQCLRLLHFASCFMPIHHFYIILKASNAPKLSISYTKPPGSKRYLKSQGIWKPWTLWLHHWIAWICFKHFCSWNFSRQLRSSNNTQPQLKTSAWWSKKSGATVQPMAQLAYLSWLGSLGSDLSTPDFWPEVSTPQTQNEVLTWILGSDLPRYVCFFYFFSCLALQHCSGIINPMKNDVSNFIPSLHNFHKLSQRAPWWLACPWDCHAWSFPAGRWWPKLL